MVTKGISDGPARPGPVGVMEFVAASGYSLPYSIRAMESCYTPQDGPILVDCGARIPSDCAVVLHLFIRETGTA